MTTTETTKTADETTETTKTADETTETTKTADKTTETTKTADKGRNKKTTEVLYMPPPAPPATGPNWILLIAAAFLAIALIVIAVMFFNSGKTSDTATEDNNKILLQGVEKIIDQREQEASNERKMIFDRVAGGFESAQADRDLKHDQTTKKLDESIKWSKSANHNARGAWTASKKPVKVEWTMERVADKK